ncbi:MAG: hypothetical protein QW491_11195 [Thermoproteota archaeon]
MNIMANSFLRQMLLIILLLVIHLAIVLAFLLTYWLTKTLGVMPSVSLSLVASFTVVVLGARGFWRLAEALSRKKVGAS